MNQSDFIIFESPFFLNPGRFLDLLFFLKNLVTIHFWLIRRTINVHDY